MISRSSWISKGASLTPQEIKINFTVLPVTKCNSFLITFFKKAKKIERIDYFHTLYLTFHIKFLNSTNWKFVTLFFQHNSLFMCLNILRGRVSRKKCNIHNYKNNTYNDDYCKGYSYRFPYSFTLTISDCHLFSNMC